MDDEAAACDLTRRSPALSSPELVLARDHRVPGDSKAPVQRRSLRRRADGLFRLPDFMAHVLHWPQVLKHKCSLASVSRPSVREYGLHKGVFRGRYAQISWATRARDARTKQ